MASTPTRGYPTFYLAATALAGFAWERAGRIWYESLPTVPSGAKFGDFAKITAAAARRLYGKRSDELLAVKHGLGDGWRQHR